MTLRSESKKNSRMTREIQVELLAALGDSYTALGLLAKANSTRACRGHRIRLSAPTSPKLAERRRSLAYNLWQGDEFEEAERILRPLLAQAIALYGKETTNVASLQRDLGNVLNAMQRLQKPKLSVKRRWRHAEASSP